MKKILLLSAFTLILLIFVLLLASCNGSAYTASDNTTASSASFSEDLLPEKEANTPPDDQSYLFDDYTELIEWLKTKQPLPEDEASLGKDYVDYIKEIHAASGEKTPLYIPYFENSPAELRKREGFSAITLMTSELYGVPWIWYYVTVGNEELIIKCACLSQKDFARVDVEKASIAVKNFSRSAPNIDNYETKSNYKSIVEKTVCFANESISALLLEPTNDSRVSLQFTFDKTMVIITGSPEIINSEAIGSISLQKVNLQ